MSRSPSSRRGFPTARVGAALTLIAWALQDSRPPETPPPPPPDAPPIWATDAAADAGPPPAGGRQVRELLPGQKEARGGTCGHPDQVAIGPGCWIEMAKKPLPPPVRCGDFYEHGGRCYLPVQVAPKPNTTITR